MADYQKALSLRQSGMTYQGIALSMSITERQARRWVETAKRLNEADQSDIVAMQAAGSNSLPHSYWVKTDTHSIYFKTPQHHEQINWLEDIAEAFKDIPAYDAPPLSADHIRHNLLTVYPVFDLHMGMMAWGKETGGHDYDLQSATEDVREAFGNLDILTPYGGAALLILGGDTLHVDDGRNETPQSKHKLDVDGRYYKVLDYAVQSVCWMIEHLHKRHSSVTVRVLRGNHDETSHMVLTFALSERYRNCIGVTVDKSPRDLFMVQHGNSLIAAHHGDKSPPQRLAMMIADVCPFWSQTRDRHVLTGHIHHDSAKDYPGIKWHSMRAFCPPDAYGAGFAPRRAMQAMVFHDQKGMVMTAHDGLWRE